jgi:hypothetical protein
MSHWPLLPTFLPMKICELFPLPLFSYWNPVPPGDSSPTLSQKMDFLAHCTPQPRNLSPPGCPGLFFATILFPLIPRNHSFWLNILSISQLPVSFPFLNNLLDFLID